MLTKFSKRDDNFYVDLWRAMHAHEVLPKWQSDTAAPAGLAADKVWSRPSFALRVQISWRLTCKHKIVVQLQYTRDLVRPCTVPPPTSPSTLASQPCDPMLHPLARRSSSGKRARLMSARPCQGLRVQRCGCRISQHALVALRHSFWSLIRGPMLSQTRPPQRKKCYIYELPS